ncbi:hypothetical protein [Halarcobacter sp.]|uniref:hypothetical protein n=1 Tax=Halarcobacter sp. TaxID=2321133 RepID=UPI002AA8C4C3|nr:hypothetical protein [Halarcobacter sp.]
MNDISNIVVYNDGELELKVSMGNNTVYLNRNQLSELFGRDIKTVGKHINNVFNEGELDKFSTVANFTTITKNSHDRFLIIDKKEVYHLGASIKDLGKKWFAFSKIDISANDLISKLD